MDLFPELSQEEVIKRVEKNWDLTKTVPFPKFQPTCHVCGSEEVLYKHCKIHDHPKRYGSKHPYRADVSFKCTDCSYVWVHGVKIAKEKFKPGFYHWKELKTM